MVFIDRKINIVGDYIHFKLQYIYQAWAALNEKN